MAILTGSLLLQLGVLCNLKPARALSPARDEDLSASDLIGKKAPGLPESTWINSSPHNLSDFQGSVVLLEFWTYGCINCRNTIPTLNEWQKKYSGKDFALIRVHTPEFDGEKSARNVRENIARLHIRYPVVTDNDYLTWESYHQQYWPTIYLIDKKGIVRYVHVGEGSYDTTERMIRSLMAER